MNKIILPSIILILFVSFLKPVYSQNTDSLLTIFSNHSTTVNEKLDALKTIKWATYGSSPEEGIKILDEGIALAKKEEDNLSLAHFYEGKAILVLRNGDIEQSKKWYEEAILYAEKGEHHRNRLMIYIRLANLSAQRANYVEQKEWLDKVSTDKEIENFKGIKAMSISELGIMYFYQGKHSASVIQFEKAVKMQSLLKDLPNLAFEQENLGRAYRALGKRDSGYFWYNEALKVYQQTKSKKGEASINYNLGMAYLDDLQYDSAVSCMIRSKQGFLQTGDLAGQGVATESLGMIYQANKKTAKAIKHYLEAIELLEKSKTNYYLTEAYGSLAGAYKELGETENAISYYKLALDKAVEMKGMQDVTTMADELSNLYLQSGDLGKAEKYVKRAKAAVMQIDNKVLPAKVSLSLANLESKKGNWRKAKLYLDSVFLYSPDLSTSLATYKLLTKIYEELGDDTKALEANKYYLRLQDSTDAINNQKLEKEILAKYTIEKAEKDLAISELESAQEKQKKLFGFVLFGLALLAMVLIIFRHKKFTKEREKTIRLEIESAEKHVLHTREILQNQSGLILDKNRIINELKNTLQQHFGDDKRTEKFDHILEQKILTKEDWEKFKSAFQILHPDFIIEMQNRYAGITEAETRMLCLYKLEMTQEEMADMLGILPRSLEKTVNRFKNKFNLESTDRKHMIA